MEETVNRLPNVVDLDAIANADPDGTECDGQPLVSIIIPAKNRRVLLAETIASLQNQTYQHWEAVVVDDGSEDESWAALQEIATRDSRIRPMRRVGSVGGASRARNQGFAASRGAFIIFLDSDDLLTPTALALRLDTVKVHPGADAVVFGGEYFRTAPGENREDCQLARRFGGGIDALDSFLTTRSPWWICSPLWRRTALIRVGPWDAERSYLDDVEFHTRATILGIRFQQFAIVDHYIRIHRGPQVSRSKITKVTQVLQLMDEFSELLEAHDKLTPRRKRMIAWFALSQTLDRGLASPRLRAADALLPWRAARDRRIVGATAYVIGSILALLQWAHIAGLLPRELARLILVLDLRNVSVFEAKLYQTIYDYIHYLIIHRRAWKQAQTTT